MSLQVPEEELKRDTKDSHGFLQSLLDPDVLSSCKFDEIPYRVYNAASKKHMKAAQGKLQSLLLQMTKTLCKIE